MPKANDVQRGQIDPTRRLQRKLYRAAKQSPARRFHALYDKVHRTDILLAVRYIYDPCVASLSYLSWALVAPGYPDQALLRSHEAVKQGRELLHPSSLAQALFFSCLLRQLLGDRQGTDARPRDGAGNGPS
jgi:hypothetical protein